MKTKAPLRVGVIGCGGIAQMMHLPTLAERPDLFDLRALADIHGPTLEAVGRRYGVRELTQDPSSLVQRSDVDAVLLLASGSHREITLQTLAADKHLFVEKPLSYGVAETEELAQAARVSKGTLMVGYHKRYDPAVQRAKELVRKMDDVRLVEVSVLHPDDDAYRAHHAILPPADPNRAPQTEAEDLRNTQKAVTEGIFAKNFAETVAPGAPTAHRVAAKILNESLIHDLNLLRGILGEPEEVVSAHLWRDGFAQTSVARFSNDARATLSWVAVPGLRNYEERVRFVGNHGRVTLVFPSPYLRHAPTPLSIERMEGSDLIVEQRTVSYEEAFRAELYHFRECILEGKAPHTSVADALGDARWIQAIARAFSGGSQQISIPGRSVAA